MWRVSCHIFSVFFRKSISKAICISACFPGFPFITSPLVSRFQFQFERKIIYWLPIAFALRRSWRFNSGKRDPNDMMSEKIFIHKMKQKSSKRSERCNLFQHLFSFRCLFGMMWENEKRWNAIGGASAKDSLNDATSIGRSIEICRKLIEIINSSSSLAFIVGVDRRMKKSSLEESSRVFTVKTQQKAVNKNFCWSRKNIRYAVKSYELSLCGVRLYRFER